ncbi:MAG: hypothetical protein WBR14_17505, partial [Candidatus Acidiferrum sp.]
VLCAFAVSQQKNATEIKTLRSIRPSRGGSLAAPCHRRANTSTVETNRELVPLPATPCCALERRIRVMGKHPHCTCTICDIEKCIGLELALPELHQIYRQIAAEKPLLAGFPTVFHLVASIHGCRNTKDGATFSDLILGQLLSGTTVANHWDYLEKLFLLVFIPTAHAAVRHVSYHYQFLAREDISQVALTTLIQCLRSTTWQAQPSHFGFVVARKLRRSLFRWARREFQSTSQFVAQRIGDGSSFTQTAEESFEQHAILRHFLNLCQQRAYLTPDEINLLIDLKLEQTMDAGATASTRRTSNLFRQRVKRLMTKLRRLARTSTGNPHHKRRSRD